MGGFGEIDWELIWREGRKKRSCKSKGASEWDRKAVSFARRHRASTYAERLQSFLAVKPDETVLDVGCGPGTMSLPLAARAAKVTALDYSAGMLAELKKAAAEQDLTNIITVQAAWEDDWHALGLKMHDLVLASRSLSVDDLGGALAKLNEWARRRVVITDRVGAGPFDPDVFAAVGREFSPGPDYIVTVNMLYRMGINARVDFIPAEITEFFGTREEAVDSCLWMLDGLQPGEEADFEKFLQARLIKQPDGRWRLVRKHIPKWAVIRWNKV